MQTLTPEQYKAKYGSAGAWANQAPSPTEPSLLGRITNTLKQAGNKEADIFSGPTTPAQIPRKATEAVATAFNTIPQVATDVLPKPARQAASFVADKAGQAINWLGEKLGSTQLAQDFVTKHPDAANTLAEITSTASNLGQTAGDILAADQGAKGAQKVVDVTKQGTQAVVEKVGSAYDAIKTNATKYPKQLADKITMGQIDAKTQTILKETPATTLDEYVKTGEAAMKDPRKLTPLEVAGQKGEQVAKVIKQDLNNIGEQKSAALQSVKDTKVPDIATTQIEKIKPLLQKKLTDAERTTVNEYLSELKSLGKNPTAGSVDATIDKLQATLYEKSSGVAIPMTTRVKSFINQSIGELNSNLKSVVDGALGSDAYSSLNAQYASKIRMFGTLNKALGEGGTKGGSLMKKFFSPQDAGTKELFATIKDQYGVDLGANATLAKFVMDTLGDTRAKSLLQVPPHTPVGLLSKGIQYVEAHLTSPKKVIQKARTITKP